MKGTLFATLTFILTALTVLFMYHRRFKNRYSTRIFHLKGHFSLIHLGGSSFIYAIPGKKSPTVRKVDLSQYRAPIQGFGIALLASLFIFVGISLLSNTGTANTLPVGELTLKQDVDSSLTPQEREKRTEEFKMRILQSANEQTQKNSGEKVELIKYVVKAGDSLGAIAATFKVPADLIAASSDLKGTSIHPGMELTIPGQKGLVYTVKKGDNLARVATFFSVDLEKVIQSNPDIPDFDMMPPGSVVFLPDATIPAPPPPLWRRPGMGRLTSGFGMRYLFGYHHMHTGIDIAMHYAPVVASRGGRVIFAGPMGTYGNAIMIDHNDGYKTLYGHLSRILVVSGQYVDAGKQIAVSGNTGLTTGPHLHFEVIRNGRPINPFAVFRF